MDCSHCAGLVLSLHAFSDKRAPAQPFLELGLFPIWWSCQAAAALFVVLILVGFAQLSLQDTRSRAVETFATLLSTACITSTVLSSCEEAAGF